MKDVFMVKYQITDKGIEFPEKEEEIIISKGSNILDELKKMLNKYRYAMDLTPKFTVKLISSYHNGYCK